MKKYRHELKFIINKNMALILQNRLKYVMTVDNNYDGPYFIRSLYFDDYNNQAYYDKINGVLNRKKYRIRIYNYDDSLIKLECKEKDNDLTSKRSCTISKDIAYKLINCDTSIDSNLDLVNEVLNEMKVNKLEPSVIVDYKRLALTVPLSNVRITFDSKISSGLDNFDIFDTNFSSTAMINDDIMVMEVKYDDYLPSYVDLILMSVPAYRQAVSKFVMCRELRS